MKITAFPPLVLLAALCGLSNAIAADDHWVGTWGCGPQLTEPGNRPPTPLANSTLRQFVRTTMGGNRLRVRFSNAYGGTNSVAMNSVHVALASGAGSGGEGDIDAATDKALTFHGAPSAVIPPGEEIWSDAFDFNLPALTNLAVSIYFGDISATTINGHPGSRTTSFIVPSNVVSAASMPGAAKTQHWYIITGVDVMADASARAAVVLGDSITDGRGSTTDHNNRWPDIFAGRLLTNAATRNVSVLNMGIGGNGIYGGLGPSAISRFDRDVLNQSGVRWVVIFEGVNDIGAGRMATNLIKGFEQFADKAHAQNLRVYGATITPFGASFYSTPSHEAQRQAVNTWIRTNKLYDAVIDFDASARDQTTLTNLYAPYDSGDHLHLSPAGYQALANSINLNLFAH